MKLNLYFLSALILLTAFGGSTYSRQKFMTINEARSEIKRKNLRLEKILMG